jgi:hypothetical protein
MLARSRRVNWGVVDGVRGRDSNSFNVYTLEVDEGGKYHIIRYATHMER